MSYEITKELMQEAWSNPSILPRLEEEAKAIADRARSISEAEGVGGTVTVESGTRPKGRQFANVVLSNADQEYGTAETGKYRVLGRAAGR